MNKKTITQELDDILIDTGDLELYDYPTNKEASEAFNTLIGWAMWMWMEEWDYTDKQLCDELKKYISLLK